MNPITLDLEFWRLLFTSLALQSVFVFAATGLVCACLKSAHWHRSLWQVCLLSFLLLVGAELTGISSGVTQWLAAEIRPASEIVAVEPMASAGETTPAVRVGQSSSVSSAETGDPHAHSVFWPGVVWLLGCGVVLVRVGVAGSLCLRMRFRSRTAGVEWTREVDSIARVLHFKRRIRVLDSPALSGPIAFGVLSPTIVLPEDFGRRFDVHQRRAIVAHEVAHLVNRDPLWHLLANAAVAVAWWNPLAWLARRHLRDASERCADEASAVAPNGQVALAEALVRLGKAMTGPEAYGLGVNGGGFHSSLGKRVERLLGEDECRWIPLHWSRRWMGRIVAGACFLVIAMFGTFLLPAEVTASGTGSVAGVIRASLSPSSSLADARRAQPQVELVARFVEFPAAAFSEEWLLEYGEHWEMHKLPPSSEDASESQSESRFFATHMLTGTFSWEAFRDFTMITGTDILSAPKVTVLSDHQAKISVAQEVRGEAEDKVPAEDEVPEVGVSITVLPTVAADGKSIHLELNAKVRELIDDDAVVGLSAPHFRVLEANVDSVTVRPGQTVVLFGFTRPADDNVVAARERELLVFVTSEIVSPEGQ